MARQHDESCFYCSAKCVHGSNGNQRYTCCDWPERTCGGDNWHSCTGQWVAPGCDQDTNDDCGCGWFSDQSVRHLAYPDATCPSFFPVAHSADDTEATEIGGFSDCAFSRHFDTCSRRVDHSSDDSSGSVRT